MPDLVPVDHDPFSMQLVPIDHDPFATDQDEALSRSMTHYPESPNPTQPYIQGTKDFLKGGLSEVLKGQGVQLPDWSNRVGDVLQSEAANTAIGMAAPLKGFGAGALGSAGGKSIIPSMEPSWKSLYPPEQEFVHPREIVPLEAGTSRSIMKDYEGKTKDLISGKSDQKIPPIDVVFNNGDQRYYVLDGHHRLEAWQRSTNEPIPINQEGTIDNIEELPGWAGIMGYPLRGDPEEIIKAAKSYRPFERSNSAPAGIGPASEPASPSITAYHGSPHDFEKFDLSRIGTGEGGQAYGHGLYFAENPEVAKEYKDQFDRHPGSKADARMYQVSIKADPERFLDYDLPFNEQPQHVKDLIRKAGSGLKSDSTMTMDSVLADLGDDIRYKKTQENLTKFKAGEMSQYDLNRANQTLHNMENKVLVAQGLREAGIPGIKYLDQGSRAGGEGTRNYVVFDDKLVDILKKYGLAGLMAGGAYHFRTQQVDHDPFATQ